MSTRSSAIRRAALAAALASVQPAMASFTGELLVVDSSTNSILRVDLDTGAYSPAAAGGFLVSPTDVVLGPSDVALVGDAVAGALEVNLATGAQRRLGGAAFAPCWIDVGATGPAYGSGPDGVSTIDLASGDQTPLSSGGFLVDPADIVLTPGGRLLVADPVSGIVEINRDTGAQAVASAGVDLCWLEATSDDTGFASGPAGVFQYDLRTAGGMTRLSFLDTFIVDPAGVTSLSPTELIVADPGAGALLLVDTSTNDVEVMSLFAGFAPVGTAVVPEPGGAVLLAAFLVPWGLRRRRSSKR